jgi:hypothetical protein
VQVVDEDSSDDGERGGIIYETESDIAAIRYTCAKKDGKYTNSACVLRINGTLEFYSNFNLVSVQKGMWCN